MTDEKTPSDEDELRFWFITTETTSYGGSNAYSVSSTDLFYVRDPALAFARMLSREIAEQKNATNCGLGAMGLIAGMRNYSPPSLISIIPATPDAAALWPLGEAIGEDGIRRPPKSLGDHPYRGPSGRQAKSRGCLNCGIVVGGVHWDSCPRSKQIVKLEHCTRASRLVANGVQDDS